MLISAYLLIVLGKHFNLLDFRFSDALDISSRKEYLKFALQTIVLTVAFEGLGILFLHYRFSNIVPSDESWWNSVFHSISAFNNAGFNILSENSLKEFQADNFILLETGGIKIEIAILGIRISTAIGIITPAVPAILRWLFKTASGRIADRTFAPAGSTIVTFLAVMTTAIEDIDGVIRIASKSHAVVLRASASRIIGIG